MKRILKIAKEVKSRAFQNKAGWRIVGEKRKYFRSAWEWRYATYLEFRKKQGEIQEWEYEPKTFWFENIKRGVTNYKPDFYVLEAQGSHFWVEVKGYMDSKSIVKLKRFKRYFPDEKIEVIDQGWFLKNYCLLDTLKKMEEKKRNDNENESSKESEKSDAGMERTKAS